MHDGRAAGYQIAHPVIEGRPIPLNRLLGTLAADADVLYVHDLAIAQEARGLAAAGSAVANMKRLARNLGFQRLALVAVNGSSEFWGRQGFAESALADNQQRFATYGNESVYMVCKLPLIAD